VGRPARGPRELEFPARRSASGARDRPGAPESLRVEACRGLTVVDATMGS